MRFLTRSVAGPVIAGLILLSLASAIVVGIGIAVLSRAGAMSDDIQLEGRRALLAERMNGLVMAVVMESRGVYFSKDTTDAVRFATPLRAFLRQMEATLEEWRPLVPDARKPQFVELEKAVRDFITFRTETARLGTEVSPDAANRQGNNEQNRANRRALNTALEAVAKAGQAEQARLDAELESFSTNNMIMMGAGSMTAVIVAFAIAFWLLRSRVTKPLLDLAATMDALAAGKQTRDPPGSNRVDEIGSMAKAVQVFARNAQHLAQNQAAEQARVAAERSRIEQAERIAAAAALVVEGARRGDFSRRANVGGAQGEVATLAAGLDDVCVAAGRFLDELDQVAAAMASGDLAQRLTTGLGGRFDLVAESLNSSLDMLSATFDAIAEGATTTSEASMQIRAVAMDLSKRSESQAASVEEMSAAIEEFSSSVKETATNATSMSAAAHDASAEAEKGGDITQRAIAAMGRIEGSTTKVRDIVVLIDGIAFQTNLLALNAAVEAARAGEHGRGFAVVATEVRRLAQQAGQAAQDIRRLIDESTTEIAGGVTLVRNAGTVLEGIIERVRALATTLGEITTAAGEQARGVEEIARAVGAIDQMTQQNAAAAEENASAAGAMAQTAEELTATVATFRASSVQRRRAA